MKGDSSVLSIEMFKSLRLVNKSFSETKNPIPQWELLFLT